MRYLLAFFSICAAAGFVDAARADGFVKATSIQLAQRTCLQAIHCGTKNGERKQYPTDCAARDDGATDIRLMTGGSCATATK